ncbi:MAG: hypothetical protein ACJAZ1_002039 [Yoonia sp.]|jgi:hypothetical protein
MNMNRLINMGLRMLMNKGVDVASRRGKKPEGMTKQARESAKKTRNNTQLRGAVSRCYGALCART